MTVKPVQCVQISFGYSHKLKTLWKRGKLPTVKYGFYGDELTLSNLSLEHVKPKSWGGKSTLSNYVLASVQKNMARGNKPLEDVLSIPNMMRYLDQFRGIKIGKFDGDKYISMILDTVYNLTKLDGIL